MSLGMVGLKDLLKDVTFAMLGYDMIADPDKVRISWPKGGQPDWNIDDDICFLRISAADDPYNRQRDVSYSDNILNLTRTDQYTRVLQVYYIFYGPNSFDRAADVRYKILLPEWKYKLAQGDVFPVPDIPEPIRAPELFQGQWWERSDLIIRFNQFISQQTTVPFIESADITIKQEDGKEEVIHVPVP